MNVQDATNKEHDFSKIIIAQVLMTRLISSFILSLIKYIPSACLDLI